jgi:hypothetical protein
MFFGVTGKKRTMFLASTLDPTLPALVPVLDPTLVQHCSIAQKRKATWRLWYWRPVMGQIGNMGFVHACPLQLLSSRQLSFQLFKEGIIGSLCFIS